jgi:hypothetical protein
MSSTVPIVLLGLSVVVLMTLMVGMVSSYYSKFYAEPEAMPGYGSIFISSVDKTVGKIDVVNMYGRAVKALLVVEVATNYGTELRTVSVDLSPGENTIYLADLLGVNPGNIIYDNSEMVVGNLRYPIVPGAGLPEVIKKQNMKPVRYILRGLGKSEYMGAFATMYFDSNKYTMRVNHDIKLGYDRDVYSVRSVTKLVKKETGSKCYPKYEVLDGYKEYNGTCTSCSVTVLAEESRSYYNTDYKSYYCGLRGGKHPYYIQGSTWDRLSYTSLTAALRGFTYYTKHLVSKDRKIWYNNDEFTFSQSWPYIADRSYCEYNYQEVKWYTKTGSNPEKVCDDKCGVTRLVTTCSDYSQVVYEEKRYACDSLECVNFKTFLAGKIYYRKYNVTSFLDASGRLHFRFNVTIKFKYWFVNNDPHINDENMDMTYTLTIQLQLPKLKGYFSIPYGDKQNIRCVLDG